MLDALILKKENHGLEIPLGFKPKINELEKVITWHIRITNYTGFSTGVKLEVDDDQNCSYSCPIEIIKG